MLSLLEQKLRPAAPANSRLRDTLGMGLLLTLTLVLLPVTPIGQTRYPSDVLGEIASPFLPAALGFMLALRRGIIDLSVWASMSLGGVVAALLLRAGVSPALALAAGAAAGLAVGSLQGLAVAWLKVPSVLLTLATACLISYGGAQVIGQRAIAVPERAFDSLRMSEKQQITGDRAANDSGASQTVQWTRMLLAANTYAVVMLCLLGAYMVKQDRHAKAAKGGKGGAAAVADGRSPGGQPLGKREAWLDFLALAVSGLLAAASGGLWLLDHNSAPVLQRPVGDLRIAAAAVLAGGLYFAGPGRSLLAGVCLLVSMLLVSVWRQEVWPWESQGVAIQLIILLAIVAAAQLALARVSRGVRTLWDWSVVAAVLMPAGILIVAAAAVSPLRMATTCHIVGIAVWSVGAAALAIAKFRSPRT